MNPKPRAAQPALMFVGLLAATLAMADGHTLGDLTTGAHRSADNIARNAARHPVETLEFFGLTDRMTVVEMAPGGGWYTEILAPYLRENGKLYTAHYDLNATSEYRRRSARSFVAKLAAEPDIYDRVDVTVHPTDGNATIGPPGEVDMVLVFRSVHGWVRDGIAQEAFATFHRTLKPGGVLGIVQHRAGPATPQDPERTTGYVDENLVIAMAKKAGFELAGRSDINANPRDTADHPEGVWTLPPSYRLGDQDRKKYADIGESDRMTLKFVKPGDAM